VTMTIRFTDDALSVGRRDGGFEMVFYTHPRLDISEEQRVLHLFDERGQAPIVDYLADRGWTRILHFDLPADAATIVARCRRVLLEVYAMRKGDLLDVRPLTKADIERSLAESAAARDPERPGEHGDGDGHP
jgi:hypothetical protein